MFKFKTLSLTWPQKTLFVEHVLRNSQTTFSKTLYKHIQIQKFNSQLTVLLMQR